MHLLSNLSEGNHLLDSLGTTDKCTVSHLPETVRTPPSSVSSPPWGHRRAMTTQNKGHDGGHRVQEPVAGKHDVHLGKSENAFGEEVTFQLKSERQVGDWWAFQTGKNRRKSLETRVSQEYWKNWSKLTLVWNLGWTTYKAGEAPLQSLFQEGIWAIGPWTLTGRSVGPLKGCEQVGIIRCAL